jgi:tight adherence protein C
VNVDVWVVAAGICGFGAVWFAGGRLRPRGRLGALLRRQPVARPPTASWSRSWLTAVGARLRRFAGRSPDPDADHRVGSAVALGLLGTVVHPAVGIASAAVPFAVDVLRRRRRARRAADELIAEVPDVVDLFRVAAGGGLTVLQAIEAVGAAIDGQLAPVLCDVHRRVFLGERLVDVLHVLARVGEPVRPLAGALLSAERDGSALAAPLERAAEHARDLRRRRAEEAARRVPVQLLFPLVVCVLPAFGLLTVVPLLAGTLQTLSL